MPVYLFSYLWISINLYTFIHTQFTHLTLSVKHILFNNYYYKNNFLYTEVKFLL